VFFETTSNPCLNRGTKQSDCRGKNAALTIETGDQPTLTSLPHWLDR
jgi:hypothetical protein